MKVEEMNLDYLYDHYLLENCDHKLKMFIGTINIPAAKGIPEAGGIFFVSSRHVESIVLMMNIIDKLTSFLVSEGILPVSKETWSVFKINQCSPENEQIKKEQYKIISDQVEKKAGIYIYMKNDNCLYIGKAKILYDRIKNHYIESFSPVPGDTKDMRWHRFFSQHQGELKIYWKEFQSEEERQIVELLLTKLLQPAFLIFK